MEPPQLLEGLVKAIQDAITSNRRYDDIALPVFDPEKNENGAEGWCRSIEKLGAEFKWTSIQQAATAGKALRGSALKWFEAWEPETERSWDALRKDLVGLYPERKNLTEKLSKAILYTSDVSDTYCDYAREKVRLLRCTKVAFTEAQLIELVCGGISEVNVRMASLNSSIGSIPDLITLFSTYEKAPRKRLLEVATNSGANGAKRFKNDTEVGYKQDKSCYTCGKSGHVMARCPKIEAHSSNKESISSKNLHTNKITCSFCKKQGHSFEKCFHRVACTTCNKMGHSPDRCFYRLQQSEPNKNINTAETK
ncbi:hypothetical protein HF086_000848 [Spodoptera exigua]|uniref:CCHC-type domain-containing protein n=1 Tax=Spodoptera exigua TaxID=7107 RepID=A0A922MDU4_SPOEX|nr:hypothetical protein HF086_000848 [Spodoptera exigua]